MASSANAANRPIPSPPAAGLPMATIGNLKGSMAFRKSFGRRRKDGHTENSIHRALTRLALKSEVRPRFSDAEATSHSSTYHTPVQHARAPSLPNFCVRPCCPSCPGCPLIPIVPEWDPQESELNTHQLTWNHWRVPSLDNYGLPGT